MPLEADANGLYLNFAHVVAYQWSQVEYLQNAIPSHEDETKNRFFCYGVNHLTDEELKNLGSYAVLDDLTEGSTTLGVVRHGLWPHRLRVYSDGGASHAQRSREAIIQRLEFIGSFSTEVGHVCKISYTGRRLYEAANRHAAQVTLQPEFTS